MDLDLEPCVGTCVWSSGSRQEEERGERTLKSSTGKGVLSTGKYSQPFPRAGGTLTLGSGIQELSADAQAPDQKQTVKSFVFRTRVNPLFHSGSNIIFKETYSITSAPSEGQPTPTPPPNPTPHLHELSFKGKMSAMMTTVVPNSATVSRAEELVRNYLSR